MLSEKDIKILLVDWLFERKMVDDAVIINEMVVANWSRRADIAVANGRLYGFEIKSQFDSLKRLPGQLESFQQYFDKVLVVAAPKFISAIQRDYPEHIGILEVSAASGRPRLRQVRAGRINEVKDVAKLTSLITKIELERFLRAGGVGGIANLSRAEMVKMCSDKNIKRLRGYVLSCIKERYSESYASFLREREFLSTAESFDMLSRTANSRVKLERQLAGFGQVDGVEPRAEKLINFAALGVGAEALIDCMPQSVLVRKRN
ncbi:sce7726 family protein [Pseudomonas sp. GXZC]|uniref:sce7726 family protein n=1 Tax=Pseudomonas sp. GXZC TaxID=3003351 RepID=UPI0022AA1AF1|nr:sce7726 family protein [Pseudomonas sp. GXZC]WAT26314.1 sce7726 family protein [Pseudomonas sp. GXZC]